MKTSTFTKRGLVVAALLSLAVVVPLEAQRGPPMGRRGPGGNRAQLEQAVRARMAEMMQQRLRLTEDEGARLSETVEEFDGQRRQVGRQEQALRRRVEALMLEGVDDDTEATELLERMSNLRLQEAELFRVEQEALLEILTPVQVLRLQQMREQLGQRIQRLRGQPGRGDGRGDGRRGGNGRGGDIRPGGGRMGLFGSGQAQPQLGGPHVLPPAGS
jgi:Spy/CpxP family protein refolding chaperone